MTGIKSALQNKIVQRCVIFVAGTAVGVGTYFATSFIEKKVKERTEEKTWKECEEDEEYGYPTVPEGVNDFGADHDGDHFHDRVVSEKYDKPDLVDYTRYSKLVDEVLEKAGKKDDKTDEEPEPKEEDRADNQACSFITESEYLDSVGPYAKADATYFTSDKILAGWNEDLVIRDIPSTVGMKAVRAFDDPSVKSVYVRNSDLLVDYEIVRCDDLFDDVVQETVVKD